MRIPWGTPTVSDATKLDLAKDHNVALTGERLYQLLLQSVFSDDFPNLNNWTVVDSGANVTVAGGIVSMNGSGSDTTNGIYKTTGVARANGMVFERKMLRVNANVVAICALHSAGALTATPSCGLFRQNNTVFQEYAIGTDQIFSRALTANTWYTIRTYVGQDGAGSWGVRRTTIEGGTEFPTEHEVVYCEGFTGGIPATIYPIMSRRTNDGANLSQWKEFRIYSGFATDGPYLTYVADAGAGRLFDGFTPTNLAAVGSWATTNAKFQYSFDDGTPSYNGSWLTLAQLNAETASTARHRYIRLLVQANSDGATQQYIGEINAADATGGALDADLSSNSSASDSSASESSASESSASEISYSASSASESSASESSTEAGGDSSGSESSASESSASESSPSESSGSSLSASSSSESETSSSSSESGESTAVNTWEQFIRSNGSYAQISIQRPTRTKSATGATLQTWATTQTLYADIQDSSPRTRARYSNREMAVDKSIYVATDPACDQGWRVLYGSEYWKIIGLEELEKTRLWRIDVEKVL